MASVESVEMAKEVRKQSTELGNKAGFHVRNWISQKTWSDRGHTSNRSSSRSWSGEERFRSQRLWGVVWIVQEDKFSFCFQPTNRGILWKKKKKWDVLKKRATIYESFGFLKSYIVRAKMLMQKGGRSSRMGWRIAGPSLSRLEEMVRQLDAIRVPRCLKKNKKGCNVTIHTFSDASEKAYAVVKYARQEYEDGTVSTQLVATKSRLAPLKAMSIPRLELVRALTGVRLTLQISRVLEIPMGKATF